MKFQNPALALIITGLICFGLSLILRAVWPPSQEEGQDDPDTWGWPWDA